MQYVLAIYESPEAFDTRTGPDQETYMAAWQAYAEALRHSGVMLGGKGLDLPSTAATVRLRGGERTVQDGPYADTKEQLGGFFIIDVPDLDTAMEWAARCPASWGGAAVEIRPVLGSCQTSAYGAAHAQNQPALATV